MKPMERAFAAYEAEKPKDAHEDAWLEAGITAYLQAIAEDAETVERVARELSFQSIGGKRFGGDKDVRTDPFINGNWHHHADEARAALLILSTISGKDKT